jgi:transposase
MNGLALQVQEALWRDPHAGDLYVFRGRRGDLVEILWHDGIGMSLYAKRLEHGRFLAAGDGRRCLNLPLTARLHARRDRLAEPAVHAQAAAGTLIIDAAWRGAARR